MVALARIFLRAVLPMQCNGNAVVQRDRKRHRGNCLPPILFSLLFSSHLSLAVLFSSHAIADMPSSISTSTSRQEKSLSPHPNPHSLISIHFALSIPTQILRASQNSRVTIDLCLNLFNFHLFNIEFHFFSIFKLQSQSGGFGGHGFGEELDVDGHGGAGVGGERGEEISGGFAGFGVEW